MTIKPEKVFKDFRDNKISKNVAINLLVSILENNDTEVIRENSLKILIRIGIFDNNLFKILENLLISDSNGKIRNLAAQTLQKKYLSNAIPPLKWALKHESDLDCLIAIIESLKQINNGEIKLVFLNELKNIIKGKWINKALKFENKKYRSILKHLFKTKKVRSFPQEELAEILINFFAITNILINVPQVFFKLDLSNGLLEELDLSDDLEYEVKGTPWGWKNNLTSLAEIKGLSYLTNLKKFNISNNQIKNIKEITPLNKLTHLILINNNISEKKNLCYIKKLTDLEYLDLRGNEIVKKINLNEFGSKLRVLLKDSLIIK